MKCVLITAIGSFSADIAIKTAKQMGWRVVGCDIYPKEYIADAANVNVFYQAPLAKEETDYMKFLSKVIREEQVNYLLPLTDYEIDVLNRNRAQIEQAGATLCISGQETIEICRNKWSLYHVLKEKGFKDLIPTYLLEQLPQKLQYPLVCKPVNGRSSQGLRYFDNPESFAAFRQKVDQKTYLVQPKVTGPIVTADVVRDPDSKKVVVIPRKELLRTLNGAGTSVYLFQDDTLTAICSRLAEVLNIRGCVNFEFIQSEDGTYHFLECNPRFSGGIEFSCMVAYQCVRNHFTCFDGNGTIEDLTSYRPTFIARKYEEYITLQK